MDQVLKSWSALAGCFIADCFELCNPLIVYDYPAGGSLTPFVATQLFVACHRSSETVLLLTGEAREWDAELVARSVLEGNLKLVYMLDGSVEDANAKVYEYWSVLPPFHSIKQSERVSSLLEDIADPDDVQWKPFRDIVIDDAEEKEIKLKYSRRERKAIEAKWSFTGICKSFLEADTPSLRLLAHLAHGYGMSSHLLHKDADGVGMVWERTRREPNMQAAVRLGHSARLVSDMCSFATLRTFFLLRKCGQPTSGLSDIEERYAEPLFAELKTAYKRFVDTEYGGK